jgi:hypothetical protein
MAGIRFHFRFPWTTIYIAILVPLITFLYNQAPAAWHTSLLVWLTSPFNITYELQGNGILYNYAFLVVIYLIVELYTRNLAHLKGRVALIRNAGLLSVLASYIAAALVWWHTGFPSSGTSILAFNVLIFAAFETYDAELIKRMSERGERFRRKLEIASLSFVALLLMISAILFIYLNGNQFWYIHILGGIIFGAGYYLYLNGWVRPRIDRFEEVLEEDVERDLKEVGKDVEADVEKGVKTVEKDIEKEVETKRKRKKA